MHLFLRLLNLYRVFQIGQAERHEYDWVSSILTGVFPSSVLPVKYVIPRFQEIHLLNRRKLLLLTGHQVCKPLGPLCGSSEC